MIILSTVNKYGFLVFNSSKIDIVGAVIIRITKKMAGMTIHKLLFTGHYRNNESDWLCHKLNVICRV